jgi:hypothetical protein
MGAFDGLENPLCDLDRLRLRHDVARGSDGARDIGIQRLLEHRHGGVDYGWLLGRMRRRLVLFGASRSGRALRAEHLR